MKNKTYKSAQIQLVALLILALTSFMGCVKKDDRAENEKIARDEYLKDNNITVAPTASGLYYIETVAGTGDAPVEGLYAKIVMDMQFLNEQSIVKDTFDVEYGGLLPGLDEMLSYMKVGGKSIGIVPSELAYGSSGAGDIPPYTTLIFNVELLDVYDPVQREKELLAQYIADNGIVTAPTASGLYYIETLAGTGELPQINQTVTVTYSAHYLSGEVFDSGTINFIIGKGSVIEGFEEGVSYMKAGGKATLIIPSDLAYGTTGYNTIPPYSTLVFDVELVSII